MSTRGKTPSFQPSTLPEVGGVVALDVVRERQRLARYRARVDQVIEQNRLAIARLYESGLLFSRHGTRVGRDLLRGHQHLLRVHDMVTAAERGRFDGAPRDAGEVDRLFDEIEALLEKTSEIARRNKALFGSGNGR